MVSLLSLEFFGLSLVAVVALSSLSGRPRQLTFLALNLAFIGGFVLGVGPTGAVVVFALAGYLIARRAERLGWMVAVGSVMLLTVGFVYLRGYDFLGWVLPDTLLLRLASTIGLSFLFFKTIHVIVDARSGTLGSLDLLTYLNYSFGFTTFMMGPIQRYQDFRAQWEGSRLAAPLELEAHLDAVMRVLVGLVKAYVIAEVFRARALAPDTNLLELSFVGLVVQTYAFWLFLYLNFSGYCDVVIGIGTLLGVRPPENFNRPFLARNISDFWLRQHRSLTLWLTDYVFAPLYTAFLRNPMIGRHKLLAANLSLVATMLVSGLWHGTTVAFVAFGLVHGLWFIVYRTWDMLLIRRLGKAGAQRFRARPMAHAVGVLLTFNATAFAFIFFQVRTDQLLAVWRHVVTP